MTAQELYDIGLNDDDVTDAFEKLAQSDGKVDYIFGMLLDLAEERNIELSQDDADELYNIVWEGVF